MVFTSLSNIFFKNHNLLFRTFALVEGLTA